MAAGHFPSNLEMFQLTFEEGKQECEGQEQPAHPACCLVPTSWRALTQDTPMAVRPGNP